MTLQHHDRGVCLEAGHIYVHGLVFRKFRIHLLGFIQFLNKNILSNMQCCVVSFGATFLILFYKTRVCCSQGRNGEKYVNFVCLS